ncbi:hypothetical protein ACOME3_004342 [Neoechinorhynchus agilis]
MGKQESKPVPYVYTKFNDYIVNFTNTRSIKSCGGVYNEYRYHVYRFEQIYDLLHRSSEYLSYRYGYFNAQSPNLGPYSAWDCAGVRRNWFGQNMFLVHTLPVLLWFNTQLKEIQKRPLPKNYLENLPIRKIFCRKYKIGMARVIKAVDEFFEAMLDDTNGLIAITRRNEIDKPDQRKAYEEDCDIARIKSFRAEYFQRRFRSYVSMVFSIIAPRFTLKSDEKWWNASCWFCAPNRYPWQKKY